MFFVIYFKKKKPRTSSFNGLTHPNVLTKLLTIKQRFWTKTKKIQQPWMVRTLSSIFYTKKKPNTNKHGFILYHLISVTKHMEYKSKSSTHHS